MWRGRNREGAVRQVSFSRLGFRPRRTSIPISFWPQTYVPEITELQAGYRFAEYVGLLALNLGAKPPSTAFALGIREGVGPFSYVTPSPFPHTFG
jgi:hypothetical protein